ncbi:sugar-transfer associated ATP-grasp domain-containing protein [Natronococcus sp. A-GB1]|uniref:sugar-transfer associated ATP-grasp domain-containing protein n=1 Tax=Natronococcus sp. A-GB1 TaxID=3037648 RepID=UPI00241E8926|nr:sugar-transfer associated ATP-grasp domain-containing protein [Natronococcus sp. A-GB1]MDG5759796.1 sugar-transfer associated ATP-grasp domain-containing protein [Natronococcus sp. A-GB1]
MNVRDYYFTAKGVQDLVDTERNSSSYSQSLPRRLALWRRGFLSRAGVIYDFERHDPEAFVSDYQRFVRTKNLNGTWSVALSNKLFFDWLMRAYGDHRTVVYGLVRGGLFHEFDDSREPAPAAVAGDGTAALEPAVDSRTAARHEAGAWVADRLAEEGKLVLKWIRGGGGENVLLCSRTESGYEVNGEHYDRGALVARVDDLENYLVCEHVEQGPYAAALYPETPNTIRVLTMYDDDAEEAFIAAAIQRMGSDLSGSMDNFSQGGLSAEIDVETGELGPAAQLPYESDRLEWHTHHPETGTRIQGTKVPAWETIRERVLELASSHPMLPYVGWDLVLTDDEGSFKVIEANDHPGLKAMQINGPLLADERVRRFYERHEVC